MTTPGLTFILALPYSGSSLFALALGNADGFVNCGEMNFLGNDWYEKRTCSCGALVDECAVWGGVKTEMMARRARGAPAPDLSAQARLHPVDARKKPFWTQLRMLLGARIEDISPADDLRDYAAQTSALVDYFHTAHGAMEIVDASKGTGRLRVLQKHLDVPLRVIVLKRGLANAFGARIKRARRRNRWYVPAFAPVYLIWLMYHLRVMKKAVELLPKEMVFHVSYEDFVSNPSAIERDLSVWYGRPISIGIGQDRVMQTPDAHVFSGNIWLTRQKGMQDGVVLRESQGKPELTAFEFAVFKLAAALFPLLKD